MPVALVTNDDGIEAEGLWVLARHVEAAGFRACIVAPEEPMSGAGKCFRVPARVRRLGDCVYTVASTPAVAVYLGVNGLLPEPPAVVVSGVNRGPNMGLEDILTSGTIGAAIEAALQGVPGVAASLASDHPSGLEYHAPASIAASVARVLAEKRLSWVVANVNSPPRPLGVRATFPAFNNYRIKFRVDGGIAYPVAHGVGSRYWDRRPGSDVEAVLSGYASISIIDVGPAGISARPLGDPLLEALVDGARARLLS